MNIVCIIGRVPLFSQEFSCSTIKTRITTDHFGYINKVFDTSVLFRGDTKYSELSIETTSKPFFPKKYLNQKRKAKGLPVTQ